MVDIVRVGVVGVGGMGSYHAIHLNSGEIKRAELTAVCDIEMSKMDHWPDVKHYADSRELIRSGEVDAVIIATPHYDHTPITVDAFENGLHVLTEKPIAVHKADAERMIAAHNARPELVFSVMFQQRTEPLYQRLKQLIESGQLGAITRINWIVTSWFRTQSYYDSGGWRATWSGEGGGVLMNQCPHNLDLLQWLFGMPSKVRSFMAFGKRHNIEVEDEVTTYLEYANGATGVFITSTGEAPGTNRLEISAEMGKVVAEDGKISFTRNEVPMSEFCMNSPHAFSLPPVWNVEVPFGGAASGHMGIVQNFVNAILDGAELIAPAEEGINTVELINSMIYSALMEKTIELPLDSAAYAAKLDELCATSKFVKKTAARGNEDITSSFK